MITKFSILNGTKHFSSGTFQNYLLFIPAKKFIEKYLTYKYSGYRIGFNARPKFTVADENLGKNFIIF